ncbi:outer membrane lipid asymmetry maintenance protein MlaD [Zavarzinia sp.]|uniref:outer membrane lipid asymmetry maintenance protein MlaD n=1 Tax=Zavarzinia sp. TaxID=2027920 RepID=UPI0035645F46
MSSNLVETLVGAVVIGVAAIFVVFAYSNVGRTSTGGYMVTARFDRVDGLPIGADVRISGIKVGSVVAQDLDPATYRAQVRMTISKAIELPDDSSAKVASEGLLGGAYIAIEPGGSDKFLQQGSEIKYTQSSVDLMGLISRAVFGAANGDGSSDGAKPATANP